MITSKSFVFYLCAILHLFEFSVEVPMNSLPPAWNDNPYVQIGRYKIIDGDLCTCITSNSSVPTATATMTFLTAFSLVPHLAYGIPEYQSHSNMGLQKFEVVSTGVSNTSFNTQITLFETTTVWVVQISFIAIDKIVPYHINTFDDVPVNYNNGALTNINVKSLSTKTYTNIIDYSTQATVIGSNFTTFNPTLSMNKIVLFLTTFHMTGALQTSSAIFYNALNLKISAAAISTTSYKLTVKWSCNAQITKIHFSILVFDYANILTSNLYYFVYDKPCYPVTGGWYPVPARSIDQFMVGFIQFSSTKTNSVAHFKNQFITQMGSHGAIMYPSVPRNTSELPFSRFCFSYLYMRTWNCPNGMYFDSICFMCNSCGIPACLVCQNGTTCASCATSLNYFLNPSGICQRCSLAGCLSCSSLTTCILCDSISNYVLVGSTCSLCSAGLFANPSTNNCDPCPIENCTTCQTYSTCLICNSLAGYFLNPDSTCTFCDPNLGYLMDPVTFSCDPCQANQCLTCANLSTCLICNEAAGYFIDPADSLCYFCQPSNCITCANLTACDLCNYTIGYTINTITLLCQPCVLTDCIKCMNTLVCEICDWSNNYYVVNQSCSYCDPINNTFINMTSYDCQVCSIPYCLNCTNLTACVSCNQTAGYFLSATTGLCQLCTLLGCLNCSSLTVCTQCDINNSYAFSYASFNMSQCGGCEFSCTCDGYGLPWISSSQTCTPIPGDGLTRGTEQCDDSNLINGDGCSTTGQIQNGWFCSYDLNTPSICRQSVFLNAKVVSIDKTGCNSFKITTNVPYITLDQIPQSIIIYNSNVTITSIQQNGTDILIYANYTRDLKNQDIIVQYSQAEVLHIPFNPTLIPLYYTTLECQVSDQVSTMIESVQIVSYVILIISALSCKIIGLELFGVLQLSYFTLSSHDFFNIYLAPLTKFKTFNGLNMNFVSDTSKLPVSMQKMQLSGNFINNCNIMLCFLLGQLMISIIILLIAKKIQNEKLIKVSMILLKQGFMTLILFNIFNIAFSAGVHFKYANPADDSYGVSIFIIIAILLFIVVSVFAMQLTTQQGYGQFKQKFKNVWICRLYVPLTVVYRMVLGFYSAVQSEYGQGSLIIMAFALIFMMYTIVNLPFSNVFQNYRCCLIHLTMLYTLLTTNYYRSMKSTTSLQIKGRIYAPAIIQYILMIACIAVSFLVLSYQIYQLVIQYRRKQKTGQQKKPNLNGNIYNYTNYTQQSINNLN